MKTQENATEPQSNAWDESESRESRTAADCKSDHLGKKRARGAPAFNQEFLQCHDFLCDIDTWEHMLQGCKNRRSQVSFIDHFMP